MRFAVPREIMLHKCLVAGSIYLGLDLRHKLSCALPPPLPEQVTIQEPMRRMLQTQMVCHHDPHRNFQALDGSHGQGSQLSIKLAAADNLFEPISSGKVFRDWIDQMMPVPFETISAHETHVITRLPTLKIIHDQPLPLQLLE